MRCLNCGKDNFFLRVDDDMLCKKCAAAKRAAAEAARQKQEEALAQKRKNDLVDAMSYYNTLRLAYETIKNDIIVPQTAGLTSEEIDVKYNACQVLIEKLPLWRSYPLFGEVYVRDCKPHPNLTGYLENPWLPLGIFRNDEQPDLGRNISKMVDTLRSVSVKLILAQSKILPRRKIPKGSPSSAPHNSCHGNTHYVAGVRYYEKNLLKLAIKNPDYSMVKQEIIDALMCDEDIPKHCFKPEHIELVPEPDNPHDSNAIKVIIDGSHVGYIKAAECLDLLEVIKQGRIKSVSCSISGGPYKRVIEDYDVERDKDVYILKRGENPYTIELNIIEDIPDSIRP